MLEPTIDTLDLTALPFWQWQYTPTGETSSVNGIPIDSIFHTFEIPDTVFHESVIAPHNFPMIHSSLEDRPDNTTPAWIFLVLLLLATSTSLLFRLRNIKPMLLLKSAIDVRAMDRLVRDCNLNHTTTMIPMGLLLVAGICLPVHQELMPTTDILGYLLLVSAIGLLYILRNGLLRLLGNTFDNKQGITLYITSNYLFHLIEATTVIALLFLYFYLPGGRITMTWIVTLYLCVGFLTRFLRSVKVFLTHQNSSSFYLFYYLCIVESIPIIVVLKWFFEQ